MNRIKRHIGLHLKGFSILVVFALTLFVSFDAFAGACGVKYDSAGNVTPMCPDGKKTRYDISPKCIEDANNASNACVNTMPTTGVSRIPEDVCFRGEGWSRKRNHNGMDYAAPLGAPVTAAADGKITRATGNIPEPPAGGCSDYGNVIYMEHEGCNGKWKTRYGHLNKLAPGITVGKEVKKGDLIGYVGGTGGACGRYHLHFEMRDASDNLINPMCDQVQELCNCNTPVPSAGLAACKDATFAAGSAADTGSYSSAVIPAGGGEVSPADKNCDYSSYRSSVREWGCIFCKPFMYIFNTASVMAKVSFDQLARAVSILVVVAFAIWLSAITLRFVSSFEIREPRIYVKTVLGQALRVLVIYVILNSDLTQLLSMTLDPVFLAGMELAQLGGRLTNELTAVSADACDLGDKLVIITAEEGGGLAPELGRGILCTIKSIQDQVGDVMALGSISWCMAWKEKVLLIIPHVGYAFTGLVLYIGAFFLLFIYPFLLVDCILKLTIAIALLPAALGAFAFKITANYLQKIWEIFMNAIFSFVFLSIIIFIIGHIAADAVAEIMSGEDGTKMQLGWWMVEVIKIVFICLLGWAVLGETKDLSSSFASGMKFGYAEGAGIGGSTGSAAGAALKSPAKKVAKSGMAVGKAAGRSTANLGKEALHHGRLKAAKFSGSLGNKAKNEDGSVKKDQQGNTVYDTTSPLRRIMGQKVESSFHEDSGGNIIQQSVRTNKDGSQVMKTSDRYGTLKSKMDKHGNALPGTKKPTLHAAALNHLTYNDGSVNDTAINNFMQNSGFSENDKRYMIMEALMNKRINSKTYTGNKLGDKKAQNITYDISSDENGIETFTVTQSYADGSSTKFSMATNNNGRAMTTVSNFKADGSGTTYATDGIMQQKIVDTVRYDSDGNKNIERTEKYTFTSHYNNKSAKPINEKGMIDDRIPREQIMFSQDHIDKFAKQVDDKGNKFYKFEDLNE